MWVGDKALESSTAAVGVWGLDDAYSKVRTVKWPTTYPSVSWPSYTNSYIDATLTAGLATFSCNGQTINHLSSGSDLLFAEWEESTDEGVSWHASPVTNTPPAAYYGYAHRLILSGLTTSDDGKLYRFAGYSSHIRRRTSSVRNLIVDTIGAIQWSTQLPANAYLVASSYYSGYYQLDAYLSVAAHGVGATHGIAYGLNEYTGYSWQTRAAVGGTWANITGSTTWSGGGNASMGTPTIYYLSPNYLTLADVGRQFRSSVTLGGLTAYSSACTLLS